MAQITRCDGVLFRRSLLGSYSWLTANRDKVNLLNVFPVPRNRSPDLVWLIQLELLDFSQLRVLVGRNLDARILAFFPCCPALMPGRPTKNARNHVIPLVDESGLNVLDDQLAGELTLLLTDADHALDTRQPVSRPHAEGTMLTRASPQTTITLASSRSSGWSPAVGLECTSRPVRSLHLEAWQLGTSRQALAGSAHISQIAPYLPSALDGADQRGAR